MKRSVFKQFFWITVPVVAFSGLVACSGVEIVGANENRVWIKSPFLSIGGTQSLAQEHCDTYGKIAELESDMAVSAGNTSLRVYACK